MLLQAGGQGSQQTWGSSATSSGGQQQQQQYVAYPIPGMGGASHALPPPPPTQSEATPATAEAPPTITDSGSVQGVYVHSIKILTFYQIAGNFRGVQFFTVFMVDS